MCNKRPAEALGALYFLAIFCHNAEIVWRVRIAV